MRAVPGSPEEGVREHPVFVVELDVRHGEYGRDEISERIRAASLTGPIIVRRHFASGNGIVTMIAMEKPEIVALRRAFEGL